MELGVSANGPWGHITIHLILMFHIHDKCEEHFIVSSCITDHNP